jgi:hypothetical protein
LDNPFARESKDPSALASPHGPPPEVDIPDTSSQVEESKNSKFSNSSDDEVQELSEKPVITQSPPKKESSQLQDSQTTKKAGTRAQAKRSNDSDEDYVPETKTTRKKSSTEEPPKRSTRKHSTEQKQVAQELRGSVENDDAQEEILEEEHLSKIEIDQMLATMHEAARLFTARAYPRPLNPKEVPNWSILYVLTSPHTNLFDDAGNEYQVIMLQKEYAIAYYFHASSKVPDGPRPTKEMVHTFKTFPLDVRAVVDKHYTACQADFMSLEMSLLCFLQKTTPMFDSEQDLCDHYELLFQAQKNYACVEDVMCTFIPRIRGCYKHMKDLINLLQNDKLSLGFQSEYHLDAGTMAALIWAHGDSLKTLAAVRTNYNNQVNINQQMVDLSIHSLFDRLYQERTTSTAWMRFSEAHKAQKKAKPSQRRPDPQGN